MDHKQIDRLRHTIDFPELVEYLRDELDWPIDIQDAEDIDQVFYEYDPEELGIATEHAVKIQSIKQVRPLVDGQPWGIFFVEFESKKLPVGLLGRILKKLVSTRRSRPSEQPVWQKDDLLFISAYGDETADQREIAFAHFDKDQGLRVLTWDKYDTPLKLNHIANTLQDKLHWPDDPDDHDAWREEWSSPFRHRVGHVIRTSNDLADELAGLARRIRDEALLLLEHETESGPLRTLYKAFQTALIQDLSEADFADTYAQTITYGLLTAAISRTDMSNGRYGTALIAENLADIVPVTNPFLKEMLETFLSAGGRKRGIAFDEVGIQDVVELLHGDETDLPAVLRDFGNKTQGEDPVIHFYEHFLAAYDKNLKIKRGVFYTPQSVVSFIVRSVHELLQTEFGLEYGLADTTTWGEMALRYPGLTIPKGTDPESPFVVILDPATGTATFLVEVIEVMYQTVKARWQRAGMSLVQQQTAWNKYVPKHLLPRLYGYELMMAPYAIAHMKIGLKLYETGYRFDSTERVRVYLTNSLEPVSDQPVLAGILPALAHEAQAVSAIKRTQRFSVVIGNPPYSVTSANSNEFINALMSDYKKHVSGEQGLVALSDDYLKFIRLSQDLLQNTGLGLWGMIANHGYLKGIIHRGMRYELIEQFNKLFILDLHGDSNIGEKIPNGLRNENVFDIQQGVAISVGVYNSPLQTEREVKHSELWGSRTEKNKKLSRHSTLQRTWTSLHPRKPNYFLVPFDYTNTEEYLAFPSIKELMPINSCGVKTHRDGLVIDLDKTALTSRMLDVATEDNIDLLKQRYSIRDTKHWQLHDARSQINQEEVPKFVHRITYRPFDDRWIYYNPAIIEKGDSKYPTLRHMLHDNIALLTSRIQATGIFNAVFVSEYLVEMKTAESSRSSTVFPLFITDEKSSPQIDLLPNPPQPNFDLEVINPFVQNLGIEPINNLEWPPEISPRDIFNYVYAIFHCPGFRSRYEEFLKIDFPRVPFTSNPHLFQDLGRLGDQLVHLHLLEFALPKESDVPANWSKYERLASFEGANPVIEKLQSAKKAWQSGSVSINASSSFVGISEEAWNFRIGGYQVCHKWLKGRKGRILSDADILHYCKIVTALNESIRIMDEIDDVIEEHGGWPLQ